jgi:hypothetical protein
MNKGTGICCAFSIGIFSARVRLAEEMAISIALLPIFENIAWSLLQANQNRHLAYYGIF